MSKLIVVTSDGKQTEHTLGHEPVWIGRSRENALPILDRRASRRHCRVEAANGRFVIIDEGSSNGTLLNGKLVDRRALEPGDVIEIGSTRIFFELVTELDDGDRTLSGIPGVGEERKQIDLLRLQRMARALNEQLESGRLLELILDHSIDIVQAERGFLLLKGDEDDAIEVAASRNFAGDTVQGPEAEISRSLARRVVRSGEPICAVNAQEDEGVRDIQSISILGLRSVLCIPLRGLGEVIGAVYLDNRLAKRAFTSEDLRMLEALADHASVALRNARLFAAEEKGREKLEEAQARVEALNAQLESIIRGQSVELEELRQAFRARKSVSTKYDYRQIIGKSPALLQLFRLMDRVVDSEVPVHVYGESGTGKELVAKAIHVHGARSDGPFVSENCAALTETLLASELFGYVKGAFTGADQDRKGLFEMAHRGTLFLDEVADMSPGMQRKMLRVLQEKEVRPVGGVRPVKVDVRILSASNRDLLEMVRNGEFREDLYYRLSVLQIRMPPLRERKADIPLLVSHFLDRDARDRGGRPVRLAPGVMDLLMAYDWRGNVRELENECLRMVALSGEIVEADILSEQIRGFVPHGVPLGRPDVVRDLNTLVQAVEVTEIEKALRLHKNNKTKAADALCISRFALQRKLEKYDVELEDPVA